MEPQLGFVPYIEVTGQGETIQYLHPLNTVRHSQSFASLECPEIGSDVCCGSNRVAVGIRQLSKPLHTVVKDCQQVKVVNTINSVSLDRTLLEMNIYGF